MISNHRLRFFRKAVACLTVLAALSGGLVPLLSGGAFAAGSDFTFAALGDTPYSAEEESRFIGMIAEMNHEKLAFVIHVGDFKAALAHCSDGLFLQRKEWFELIHHALVYVPGDNEWTDCNRAWGSGYRPLERLQKLRELFFNAASSLGQS